MANCRVLKVISCFSLYLNLVFCEVRENNILKKADYEYDFVSLQIFSRVNMSVISEEFSEAHHYNSTVSFSCSNNSSSSLCTLCEDGLCRCGDIPYDILQCIGQNKLSVLDCHCITYDEEESQAEIGSCLYNCANTNKTHFYNFVYRILPENVFVSNEMMCGNEFFRAGTLCGKCKSGYFPQVYSFNMTCVECPHGKANWWKFVLSAFLPLTIFYFIVVFFKINVTYRLHGFVFYSQLFFLPSIARLVFLNLKYHPNYLEMAKYIGSFYGIWNLDLFRAFDLGICLGTDTLQTLSLDIAVGIYPLLLMVLSYVLIEMYDRNFRLLLILWKPFLKVFSLFRRNWDIRTSVIDAYTTFFLLSNVKFLSVSFDLLIPVKVYQLSSTMGFHYSWRLFYDATVPYFGDTHLPYAILAIVTLFLFVLIPMVIIILYPFKWFQKLLNIFPFRWYILHTFMDSFHGCYKNGMEPGTHDCRWFASLFCIVRFLLFLIGLYTLNMMCNIFGLMCLILLAILMINIRPFKADFTDINAIFIILLALFFVTVIGINIVSVKMENMDMIFYAIAASFSILPLLYVSVIVLYWIFSRRKFGFELIGRLRALSQGYSRES